jgi:hypothetical protein
MVRFLLQVCLFGLIRGVMAAMVKPAYLKVVAILGSSWARKAR